MENRPRTDGQRLSAATAGVGEPPLTRRAKFRMVMKVIELRLRFIALMAGTGLVFGYWDTLQSTYEKWARPTVRAALSDHTEYYCPMHPSVVRSEPSSCPICGMPLSKRLVSETVSLPEGVTARVSLGPGRVAQAGVRTVEVSYEPLTESLTTVGTVVFDERRLARIASRLPGMARVERLVVNVTGDRVEAGKPLAELYSPELYQAIRELLVSARSAREAPKARSETALALLGDNRDRVRLGREKLALWGLGDSQIDAILATGQAEPRVPIPSPIGGVVVKKNVVEGQYVAEGEALFEVADLDHVWVRAQVFADRIGTIRVGQPVEATVEAYPGEVFPGTVALIDPIVDPATRTIGVRYDLANPGLRLRPGMFATVTLRTPVAESPAFAGRVRPRATLAGQTTATDQKVCPVTTLKLGAMGEPVSTDVDGWKIWMCCSSCESKLKANPSRFLARLTTAPEGAVLSVPESAVIDTGTRKVVYVEAEPGVYEGRTVVLGPRSGDRFPVLEGLLPGERVVAAGAFLIDAETRLNPGTASTYFGSGAH